MLGGRLTFFQDFTKVHLSDREHRLPNPALWLDIFQKVKALGFNAISTYVNWSLLEATKGSMRMDGIFAYDEFFKAARAANIYVIVRPGP